MTRSYSAQGKRGPGDVTLAQDVEGGYIVTDANGYEVLLTHQQIMWLAEQMPGTREVLEEIRRLRGILTRVLASSEDGTLEIPDVVHAMEAEIREALNDGK